MKGGKMREKGSPSVDFLKITELALMENRAPIGSGSQKQFVI